MNTAGQNGPSSDRRALLTGMLSMALLGGTAHARAGSLPPSAPPPNALPLPDWPGQVVTPLALFRCGRKPKGVAFSPDGRELWASLLDGPPSVAVYAMPDGAELATLSLGVHGAVELLFRQDGRTVWASQMETHRVFEIDARTRLVRRMFDTKSNWSKVIEASPDGTKIYVSNWNFDDISEIDLATGTTLRRIPTAKTPRGMYATACGRYLYVACFGTGAFERITLETGEREELFVGRALRHIVASPDERVLYVSDMGRSCIHRYDVLEDRVTQLCKTDSTPNTTALSPDGRVLFVSNRGPNGSEGYMADGPVWGSVLLIDTTDGSVLDSIVGGNQCTALSLSRDGKTLAFSDFRDDTIRIYGIPSYEELKAAGWPRREVHKKDLVKKRA